MWWVRDIRLLKQAGKTDEAVAAICKKFEISVQHAEDILRELGQYQWHERRQPGLDARVEKMLKEDGVVATAKMLRAEMGWGLLECKLYMEDLGLKKWPEPRSENKRQDDSEAVIA